MNKLSKIATIGITSVVLAASAVSPAYAWHPKGKIVKSVKNVTAGGDLKDANSTGSAVSAQPGDTLLYSITISNTAAKADKQYNDLAYVVMKDSLPEGVEMVSNPAQRQITENIGTILPGKSVTKQYTVKVTATTDGKVIENKACYDGDSVVKDNKQKGCDVAIVKVSVPVKPVTPVAPVTPKPVKPVETTPTPVAPVAPVAPVMAPVVAETPEVLPATGPVGMVVFAGLAAVAGYVGNLLRLRRAVRA